MKVILTGAGVEDSHSPAWGHAVLSLRAYVSDVSVFDPVQASALALKGSAQDQWEWMLDAVVPDRVVVIPSAPEADELVLSLARLRGAPVTVIDPVGLSRYQHADAIYLGVCCNTALFSPCQVGAEHDAVLCGPATSEGVTAVEQCVENHSVRIYGEGWGDYSSLRAIASGARPYSSVPDVLATGRTVFAVGPDESPARRLREAEAAAMGLPVARYAADIDAPKQAVPGRPWREVWHELLGAPSVEVKRSGPKMSIITGIYNVERYAAGAIESVLQQSFEDFELLIAHDDSPDGSRAIAERYAGDPRVRIIDHPRNIGQTGRFDLMWRNLQRYASGELLTCLGSDDRMTPERLQRQADVFAEEPETGILFGGMRKIDENGTRGDNWIVPLTFHSGDLLKLLLGRNFVTTPTFMCRRLDLLEKIGDWDEGFAADYRLWLKAATTTRFRYMPEELLEYRVHEQSASTGSSGVGTADREGVRLMRQARAMHTMLDCYPSLAGAQADEDWAAAHIDLGNEYLKSVRGTVLAEAEFDIAAELAPQHAKALHANRALARLFQKDQDGAAAAAAEAGVTLDHVKERQILYASEVSTVPFVPPADANWWDGTPVTLARLLVLMNWDQPHLAGPLVDSYIRTCSGKPIDMTFITNGVTEEQAMAGLGAILPGEDFEASMTLARCNDLAFLPLERYLHVFDCQRPGNEAAHVSVLNRLVQQL